MKIGFIGAGKVGSTLGKFFSTEGVPVTGYYSRHRESAQQAAQFTKTRIFHSLSSLVAESDTVFVTVPDGEIPKVFSSLKSLDLAGKQICHCSGALTAGEAFPGVETTGAAAYSIHPLFPVSNKTTVYRELKGVFFCLEGPEPGLSRWSDLLTGLGCKTLTIQSKDKVKYHTACTMASNLVCGLLEESLQLMEQCGLEPQTALEALKPLIEANIRHTLTVGPEMALTGPVERNDTGTVSRHIAGLKTTEERQLYCACSRELVTMAEKKHPDVDYSLMNSILEEGLES